MADVMAIPGGADLLALRKRLRTLADGVGVDHDAYAADVGLHEDTRLGTASRDPTGAACAGWGRGTRAHTCGAKRVYHDTLFFRGGGLPARMQGVCMRPGPRDVPRYKSSRRTSTHIPNAAALLPWSPFKGLRCSSKTRARDFLPSALRCPGRMLLPLATVSQWTSSVASVMPVRLRDLTLAARFAFAIDRCCRRREKCAKSARGAPPRAGSVGRGSGALCGAQGGDGACLGVPRL